jgi:hypothetical protein
VFLDDDGYVVCSEEDVVAKLSAKKRAELKPSQFGLPEKARTKQARKEPGNYPMPDEGHAISAVRLAKKNRKDGNLTSKEYKRISRKAHRILKGD